jgi:tetratricopeptide (TPR) repeat protein
VRFLFIFWLLLLASCANPLNRNTYHRYYETGAEAERQLVSVTAEIAYSRALGNVYMGNLGPVREAEALFNLGRMERVNGKFDLAKDHLIESLEIDENVNGAETTYIKSTLGEISMTFYDMGDYEQGLPYLDRLYDLDESTFYSEQSKGFIAEIFSDYAKKLREMGLADRAAKYESRVIK